MVDVAVLARRNGGLISRRRALLQGATDPGIRRAVAENRVQRIRAGWYAVGGAPREVLRAVRAGGVLACTSALELQGVWTMPEPQLHVRVARGVSRAGGAGVRVHWSDRRSDGAFPVEQPVDAVRCLVTCVNLRAAVVALDSVVQLGMLRADQVAAILAATARGRSLAPLLDPASESGTETLVRLALRRARVTVRTQVPIAGIGRVDLLVGDRLVLEVDGRRWHDREDTFESDRTRDRALVERGYLVMRASYRQVMADLPTIQRQVLSVVRRRAHRWPSARR